jgi:hypothetical protein
MEWKRGDRDARHRSGTGEAAMHSSGSVGSEARGGQTVRQRRGAGETAMHGVEVGRQRGKGVELRDRKA